MRSQRIHEALEAIDRAKEIMSQYEIDPDDKYRLAQVLLNIGIVISCMNDSALTYADCHMLEALAKPIERQAMVYLGVK